MLVALFRLAEKLGHHDPYALGELLPGRLFAEWVAYWGVRANAERQAVESARKK